MIRPHGIAVLLVALASASLNAQANSRTGHWVNLDPGDQGLFILVFESGGRAHQLMPAPQMQATYAVVGNRVAMKMNDGSADTSFIVRGDTLLQPRESLVWGRVPGTVGVKGSVRGTWRPLVATEMEAFMTLRTDAQVVLEVGFPIEASVRGDTLRVASPQFPTRVFSVRQRGDTLLLRDAKGADHRFVRRPWGCLGIGNFDAKAKEC